MVRIPEWKKYRKRKTKTQSIENRLIHFPPRNQNFNAAAKSNHKERFFHKSKFTERSISNFPSTSKNPFALFIF
ncbi:hypothetical protein C1H46_022415 [Malus baccata]|uniref:Uncharacterized protein n=1 Tax=Malus baccata TaxID=106549 RepID=A0A540LZT8_MALBA|nr:hypothetical protein C1H46_022415 [Malus baccata]